MESFNVMVEPCADRKTGDVDRSTGHQYVGRESFKVTVEPRADHEAGDVDWSTGHQ